VPMCLSPDAYVEAVVYERLRLKGVPDKRARGVARKVRRAYALKRRQRAAAARPALDRSDGD
jgi:hypothetical protein